MRILTLLFLSLVLIATSCSTPDASPTDTQPTPRTTFVPKTLADSIAFAHGFDHWQDVQQLDFRFDVDISGENKLQREWSWFPKLDSVIRTLDGTSTSIIRNTTLDSNQLKIDGQFINDTYWLLMPFYLIWNDGGYTTLIDREAKSPLVDELRTMLTIQYGQQGGYTPGDAYDLFVDENYKLREWTFRKEEEQ